MYFSPRRLGLPEFVTMADQLVIYLLRGRHIDGDVPMLFTRRYAQLNTPALPCPALSAHAHTAEHTRPALSGPVCSCAHS